MKTPTIYEIKRLTAETSPYFFTRGTLKWFGQTMKSFKVQKYEGGKFLIYAPIKNKLGTTARLFNPETNQLEPLPHN